MKTPLRNLVLLWAVALCAPPAFAGHDVFGLGSGRDGALDLGSDRVINTYARLTADVAAGTTVLPVSTSTGFAQGDLVMVLRTTGLEPEPESQDSTGDIDLTSSPVGQWELARLRVVTIQRLELEEPLVRAYAGQVTQVIRVPEYTTVNIGGSGSIRAQAWDGATGGVVAFLATGTVTNNGLITASGAGFRGGVAQRDTSGRARCTDVDEPGPQGQQRGEGIVYGRYGSTGLGSLANAGGGGVCVESGGAGGGNGGPGGHGGRSWASEQGGGARDVGGWGGSSLDHPPFQRLMLGGGGGAGHCTAESGPLPHGGAGGGAIFIRAHELAGAGHIEANGASAPSLPACGAGGGGAGGTLSLRFARAARCGHLQAQGGNGGNVDLLAIALGDYRGPGGSGGGGVVHLQASTRSCQLQLAPGAAGNVVFRPPLGSPQSIGNHGAGSGGQRDAVLWSRGLQVPGAPSVSAPAAGSTTGSVRPVITGTTLPGAQVILTLDGVAQAAVQADGSGRFSFTPMADLSEGEHQLTAVAELELLRSLESEPHAFRVDTTAPTTVIDEPTEGQAVGTRTPIIRGTTEQGAQVTVILDGQSFGPVTAQGRAWTFTPELPLAQGEHTVQAQARDAAGNEGSVSATRRFSVDTVPPGAPTLLVPLGGAVLSTTRPTFSGEADSGSRVSVIIGGRPVAQVTAGEDGTWSVTPTEALPDGEQAAHATAADEQGNTSAPSAEVRFTVDTTPPAIPVITAPAPGAQLTTLVPVLTGEAEPGSTIIVVIDSKEEGTAVAGTTGGWSFTPTAELAEGRHTLQVQAKDAAGNTSSPSTPLAFHVDTAPPEAPAVTEPVEQAWLATGTPVITGNAEPGSIVIVAVGGVTAPEVVANAGGAWSATLSSALPDARHTLQAHTRDAAGNESLFTTSVTFTVDTRAPGAPVLGAPGPRWLVNSATPRLSGTAEPGTTVTVRLDEEEAGTAQVNDRGEWTFTPTEALEHGTHGLNVRARDRAGNEGVDSSHDFTVDLRAPLMPVIATPRTGEVVGPSFATLTGTAEPGATVHATLDGLAGGQARVDATGRWSLTLFLALLSGEHTVVVSAADDAGNTGPDSAPLTFSVDLEPPSAPRLTVPTAGAVLATPTPDFSGTAEAGTTVTVIIDGEALGTVEVSEAGVWTFTPEARLTDGVHQVRAQARDGVGLTSSASTARSFTVDTAPPDTFLAAGPEALTQTREAFFQLSASEAGASFECRMDGGTWASCASPLTLEELAEGAHTLEVRARDTAGNADPTPARHAWTIALPKEVEGGGVGCAAGGASALAPLAWLAWAAWLGARRRR